MFPVLSDRQDEPARHNCRSEIMTGMQAALRRGRVDEKKTSGLRRGGAVTLRTPHVRRSIFSNWNAGQLRVRMRRTGGRSPRYWIGTPPCAIALRNCATSPRSSTIVRSRSSTTSRIAGRTDIQPRFLAPSVLRYNFIYLRSTSVTTTLAPGTAACEASVTSPRMAAVKD